MDYWFIAKFKTSNGKTITEYTKVSALVVFEPEDIYKEAERQAKTIARNESLIFVSTRRINNPTG